MKTVYANGSAADVLQQAQHWAGDNMGLALLLGAALLGAAIKAFS